MKHILMFSTAYLPMQGGAELAVKEITDRIQDCEFSLICARLRSDLQKTEKIGNINIYRVGFGNNFDKILLPFFGFLKARKIYKRSAVSDERFAIWSIMISWGSLGALMFKTFNQKVPFLLTLQEGDAEDYIKKGRWGLINLSWKWVLRKADFVQAISNYLAKMAREYGYNGEIEVVPNGANINKFSIFNFQFSIKDKIINLKKKLGIKDDEKIIISVSRLVEKNGISDLINAISQLSVINYQLLIIGSGPLENKLKSQVKNLGLEKKVIFLGDIPNEEVFEYLAISDVFCRPSLSEGLGTAFLEAMAMGVPVIATRVGGILDFIRDPSTGLGQETGLFCEIKNPKNIAEKINLLLTDENLRQKLIDNGRKLVEEKYDWNKIAKKMEYILSQLRA